MIISVILDFNHQQEIIGSIYMCLLLHGLQSDLSHVQPDQGREGLDWLCSDRPFEAE